MKVSSASTIPLKPEACRSQGRAETDDASGRPSLDGRRRAPRFFARLLPSIIARA